MLRLVIGLIGVALIQIALPHSATAQQTSQTAPMAQPRAIAPTGAAQLTRTLAQRRPARPFAPLPSPAKIAAAKKQQPIVTKLVSTLATSSKPGQSAPGLDPDIFYQHSTYGWVGAYTSIGIDKGGFFSVVFKYQKNKLYIVDLNVLGIPGSVSVNTVIQTEPFDPGKHKEQTITTTAVQDHVIVVVGPADFDGEGRAAVLTPDNAASMEVRGWAIDLAQ